MLAGVAREARSGRSKAREVSRKLARIHRGAREELSKAEDVTLWILGGVAVLGGGYLAYQALNKPAAASTTTTTTTTTTPGTSPSPSPSPSPSTSSSTVSWPSDAYPWAPPSNPAALPVGFSLTDDLTGQDPMWIAMAQAALNILTRVSSTASATVVSSGLTGISYSTTPNGVVDTSFMIAMTQLQVYLSSSIVQMKGTGSNLGFLSTPHTNGILDLKSLAFLILTTAGVAATTGTPVSPTTVTDPILSYQATTAIGNMVNAGSAFYSAIVSGITAPITLSTALPTFQSNWDATKTALTIPVTGSLDWVSWAALETFGG